MFRSNLSRRPLALFGGSLGALVLAFTGPAITSKAVARADPGLPIPTVSVPRFAPEYMSYITHTKPTVDQAVALAKNFDVIAAQPNLAPYLGAMRAANPSMVIVGYVNAMYSPSSNYPADEYSYDSAGNRITTHAFGNLLMDPTSSAWRDDVSGRCASMLQATHYDGCFLDSLGQAPFGSGYTTGQPAGYTPDSWLTATSALAAAIPAGVKIVNGLGNGSHFTGSPGTSALLGASSGGMAETWLRVPSDSPTHYRPVTAWQADVDMLAAAVGPVLVTPKLWVNATAAQVDSWHRYALATFLLGTSGQDFFNFSAAQTFADITANAAMDHVDIGTPAGTYRAVGGAYIRNYTKGIVLVHPSDGSVQVSLPAGTYHDLSGATVSGSVTLGSHEGSVLTE